MYCLLRNLPFFFNFEKCGRPGGGGFGLADVREGGFGLADVCGQGGGEGSKISQILRTSFMDGPYPLPKNPELALAFFRVDPISV